MNNRIRYTLDEIQRNTYYQMPKFLFEGEFENLSNDARVLYTLLRDRHELSIKNHWVNEQGEVYLVFSREKMCETLNLSKPTIIKVMNDLKKYNLIEETRLGQGKPNRIYLLMVASPLTYDKAPKTIENTETEKKLTSESKEENPEGKNFYLWSEKNLNCEPKKNLRPQVNNFSPIKTEVRETLSSETESYQNQIPSNRFTPAPSPDCQQNETDVKTDGMGWDETQAHTANKGGGITESDKSEQSEKFDKFEKFEERQKNKEGLEHGSQARERHITKPTLPRYSVADVEQIIKENIEYEDLIENKTVNEEILNEIVYTIVHTICNDYPDGYIRMGDERVFAEVVRSTFLKLNMLDIEYFVECFNKQTKPITRMTSYIRKSLFYNHGTLRHYYGNRVLVHMPQLAD